MTSRRNRISWMRGDFNPIAIEIKFLQVKLQEAIKANDRVSAAIILGNLRSLAKLS